MSSQPIAVLDFETTGLSPNKGDRITEVGVVIVDNGRIVSRYQSLVNAGVRIPEHVESLTGISNLMISKAPTATDVVSVLQKYLANLPVVAHNASFDRKFLDAELSRIGKRRTNEFICSMRVARKIFPASPNHKLQTLIKYAGLSRVGDYHRAMADAEMTANLWMVMEQKLRNDYRIQGVSHQIMAQLQSLPANKVKQFLEGQVANY